MKKIPKKKANLVLAGLLLTLMVLILASSNSLKPPTNAHKASINFLNDKNVLDSGIVDFHEKCQKVNVRVPKEIQDIKSAFLRCKKQYKLIEIYTEYFFPYLNFTKPFLAEINEKDNETEPPQGFAVIENILFTQDPIIAKEILTKEVYLLQLI